MIRPGRQIRRYEWMVPLKLAPQSRKKYNDPTLPQTLHVRLIRVPIHHGKKRKDLWLVTTLMDAVRYPRKQIAKLYRGRWGVEMSQSYYDPCHTFYHMEVLDLGWVRLAA